MRFVSRALLVSVALVPGVLLAEVRPTSLSILGGGGGYSYSSQPDVYTTYTYASYFAEAHVPAGSPLKVLADVDASSPMRMEAASTALKVQFEELFLQSHRLGFTAAGAYAHVTESCKTHCGEAGSLLAVQSISSVSAVAFINGLLYGPVVPAGSLSYAHATADLGLNFHFAPDSLFDPYVGAVVGVGFCSIPGADIGLCTLTKTGLRAGTRVNVDEHLFLILQAEADNIQMSVSIPSSGASALLRSPVPDKHALVGFGYSL